MKTKKKYYKGILKCDFSTKDLKKVGKSTTYTSQAFIELEPRYRYHEVEEISEEEYIKNTKPGITPYIKRQDSSDVEFHFKGEKDPIKATELKKISEIILVPVKIGDDFDDNERYFDTKPIDYYLKEEADDKKEIFYSTEKETTQDPYLKLGKDDVEKYYSPFEAFHGKISHGKIKGTAYCMEVQMLDDNDKPLVRSQVEQVDQIQKRLLFENTTLGGLLKSTGLIKPTPPMAGVDIPAPTGRGGCFGRKSSGAGGGFGGGPGGVGGTGAGGCFNRGGGNNGCMMPLLLLLLGGLIWWLLNHKGCNDKTATAPPIIIHDTIKVEVQKIDTLMIVKTDTVSYVDSTTKLNYETVNLPNVQFITNSDVLLPSSASDLQKLAEYLIKNDSLNATILGHTDNVGKPGDNLRLSQRRAESVKRFLGSLGVNPKRLTAVGKGDTEPKADNKLEEGRLMNRRVEVQLTNTEFVTTKRTQVEENNAETNNKNKKKNEP